jgi:hypothetical protein
MPPMPRPIADCAPERRLDAHPIDAVPSSVRPAVDLLHGPDPSIHMLGLPKAYPQLGRWVALAILTGAIVAFLLVVLANG